MAGGSSGQGAPSAPPSSPNVGFIQPPEGVLRRAGDDAIFWEPNNAVQTVGGPAVTPAGANWIDGFLDFYGLFPGTDPAKFLFNRAPSDMATLTQTASEQAQLAGYMLGGNLQSAATKILEAHAKAQADGKAVAQSQTVISDAEMEKLAHMKMSDMLDALEEIRKDHQLDTVARRAKQPRLRLGVLSAMHDLSDEWARLLKSVSEDDQTIVRKHIYGSIIAGDQGDGPAPAVDPASKGDSRRLTSAEIAYVDAVFRGSIDYSKVTITKGGLLSKGSTRTVGNGIHFTPASFVSGTTELLPAESETLVHEMTHVWQYQHEGWTYAPSALWAQLKGAVFHGSRNAAYEWRPAAQKHAAWDSLNPEAQAEAVEDYNTALRRVLSGQAGSADYDTLNLVKPWVQLLISGPKR